MTEPSEKRRLSEFFRSEYRKLLGFVRRRVDDIAAQDAEDFVQDVAAQLFEQVNIAAPIEHLSAYVYRSLSNRIADHFRRRRPTVEIQENGSDDQRLSLDRLVAESGYVMAPEIRQMEIAHDLYRLLEGLSEEEQRLIVATDIQGLTFARLAEQWNVPINTLLSRKSRALQKIRRQVQSTPQSKEISNA
jgi:RNA polymerase sigma factor (sigma-70 family)